MPPATVDSLQHYAFLVDDATFDDILGLVRDRGIHYWADPPMALVNQINTNHGGRGFYFKDPAGHGMEVITRPYGSPE